MINELLSFLKQRKKVNLAMVILNIGIFFAMLLTGGFSGDESSLLMRGVMYPPCIFSGKEYYRLFTCMFLHFGVEHLLFNMLLLLFAGDMLESKFGAVRYLLIYLPGGVAGNLLSLSASAVSGDYAVSAGASGAIFAVIGALVWIVLLDKKRARDIDKNGLCAMAVLSLIQGFWDTGTDNFAHLGGFIAGFLLAAILGIVSFREKSQKA